MPRPALHLSAAVLLGILSLACGPRPATPAPGPATADAVVPRSDPLLSSLVRTADPLSCLEPASEQRPAVAVGTSPATQRLEGTTLPQPTLPRALRELGETQLRALAENIALPPDGQLEAWPIRDELGRLTWAAARRRDAPAARWTWLESDHPDDEGVAGQPPLAYLPWTLDPECPDDHARIFDDFLRYDDLYEKRTFGDCVWTDRAGREVRDAWLPTASAESYAADRAAAGDRVCRVLPQPASFNGRPVTFVVGVAADGVLWPADLAWVEPPAVPEAVDAPQVMEWPADAAETFREVLAVLSGEEDAVFEGSGRRVRFERKNAAQADNQLLDVVAWLEERYAALGVSTRREEFSWRGIPQANLIAVLPGMAEEGRERPVLMADHIDTAFAEDVFARTGERVSAPGADDNGTATATLLLAARVLADVRRVHDIWLVHLTGEEFPGDDLGARHLVETLLADGVDVAAILQLDMIGWRAPEPPLLQVSGGSSVKSLAIGARALRVAERLGPDLQAALRTTDDPRSYLYNSDGMTFDEAGFPVVLFNEHLNALENIDRAGYHDSGDVPANVDLDLAVAVARIVIETAAQLAAE
jgi:hypothetical protein